jgi:hypothetical protein
LIHAYIVTSNQLFKKAAGDPVGYSRRPEGLPSCTFGALVYGYARFDLGLRELDIFQVPQMMTVNSEKPTIILSEPQARNNVVESHEIVDRPTDDELVAATGTAHMNKSHRETITADSIVRTDPES